MRKTGDLDRPDKAFKAKIALKALLGEKTIQELAQIHWVHPQVITNWKKQLIDNAAEHERA